MKRHRGIWIGITLGVVVVICGLLVWQSGKHKRLTMTLLGYRKWPHGAMLRLKNDTSKTIRYVSEPNETPMGAPLLRAEKTAKGWVLPSVTIDSIRVWTAQGGGGLVINTIAATNETLFLKPATPPKPGDRVITLFSRNLKPGESVDFFVFLEARASPVRFGTICVVPQSELDKKLEPWIARFMQWCRIKKKFPGQVEVWCEEALAVSESGEPVRGK